MIPITYKAMYRVFRPQIFADVIGQETVTQTLKNAIREGRISHAYLFNGPRGTGKTSTAKIFAKAVNCENPQDGEPCNQCASCIGIQDGSVMDVMEIDAASNRGVDEIRDIRDKVMLRPSAVRFKVYIIDEVHMLTTEAFNALLKTLEEPPPHVIFILATTEPHKLPLTIISRCQRYDFRKISLDSIVEHLQWVCQQKQVDAPEQALRLIAKISEGGMRDALSLLDQAYSFCGNHITLEDIYLITGTVSQEYVQTILKELKGNNAAKAISLLDQALLSGKEPDQILKGLFQYLRDMLIYKNAPELEEVKERLLIEPEFPEMAGLFSTDEIYQAIDCLNKTQNEMKWTQHPRILTEVALIQLCEQVFKKEVTIREESVDSKLLQRIQALEEKVEKLASARVQHPEPVHSVKADLHEIQKRVAAKGDFPIHKLKTLYQQANDKYLQAMNGHWPQILDLVRQKEVRTEAWLKQGKPVLVTEQSVLLGFGAPMHREMTEKPENKQIIQQAIYEKTNRKFEIYTVMMEQWNDFLANVQNQENQDDEAEDPLIQKAIDLFGEELVKIKK